MDMTINITNGVETCAHFCPLLPGEGLDALALDPNATDMGAVTWQGQPAEQYQWIIYDKVPIIGKVKMATVDFYTDNKGTNSIPLFSLEHVTPYNGAETGTQNVSYTQFVPGPPPASKFKIAGMAACPSALHAGRSTRVAPRGPLHGCVVVDLFYTDVRSILILDLLAFQRQSVACSGRC